MAPSDLNVITDDGSWTRACIDFLPTLSTLTTGFTDKQGHLMHRYTNATWGITYSLCQEYCNTTAIPTREYIEEAYIEGMLTDLTSGYNSQIPGRRGVFDDLFLSVAGPNCPASL